MTCHSPPGTSCDSGRDCPRTSSGSVASEPSGWNGASQTMPHSGQTSHSPIANLTTAIAELPLPAYCMAALAGSRLLRPHVVDAQEAVVERDRQAPIVRVERQVAGVIR